MSEFEQYLDRALRMGELLFAMKLELYENSSILLLEAATANNNSTAAALLSNILLDPTKVESGAERTDFVSEADEFVYTLYRGLPSGFTSSPSDDSAPASAAASASTTTTTTAQKEFDPFLYGEVAPEGVSTLIGEHLLPVVAKRSFVAAMSKNTEGTAASLLPLRVTFVDLGSGVGKAAMDVALCCAGVAEEQFVVHSLGVELDAARHGVAARAKEMAMSSSNNKEFSRLVKERVTFLQQDMLLVEDKDDSALGAVFAFCCGVAFDKQMCGKIVQRVLAYPDLLGAVFLFKQWPFEGEDDGVLLSLPESGAYDAKTTWEVKRGVIATSWMSAAPCYVMSARE